ncbi:MGDG synthase family glycosyltransferase [Metabacillus iocasae]|uniref:Processive 1,2-diacylglycerol beta-glucosyltransferase n=1 Tax=Priestia iocasae TaxID=2291674 RepID=A0ABS2QRH9_9BACI|nr:glycosyltransferase [Metabacillus iocasae]MBM7702051.1 processive 1,2-diacylglycerol beta-glucosyltransferase [Metabacillus iocasae]
MKRRPKFLLLTAEYGNGHVQVAKALVQELLDRNCADVVVSSIYSESYPTLTTISESMYLKSYTPLGKPLYSFCYHSFDKVCNKKVASWITKIGQKRLRYLIESEKPDVIINTFPVLAVSALRRKTDMMIPVVNIITDYCVHNTWVQREIDKYYVASAHTKEKLHSLGVPHQSIVLSGIPIRSSFEDQSSIDLISKYQIDPTKKVILIMAGAFGVLKKIKKLCEKILSTHNCQVIVVCGKDDQLKEELQDLQTSFPTQLNVFGYVEQVHELYKLASLMITKPGGITLTEAAAVGVPLLLYKPTPGQEKSNALFFEEKGAAMVAYHTEEVYQIVYELLEDDLKLEKMKHAIQVIYQPQASKTIINDLIDNVYKDYLPLTQYK